MELKFETNLPQVLSEFDDLAKVQMPYAHTLTLTILANKAKDKLIQGLPSEFILRRRWVKDGIRARPAEKRDYPNSVSYVGSIDPFMPDQALGGTKEPTGSQNVSIPVDIRKNITSTTPKSKWPSELLASHPTNYAFISPHGDQWFVYRKRPIKMKGKRAKAGSALAQRRREQRDKIKLLYLLKPQVHIKERWPFQQTVEKEVENEFFETFLNALGGAIASRK